MAVELPPVIVELLAKNGQFLSAMKDAKGEVTDAAKKGEVGFNSIANAGKMAAGGVAAAAIGVGLESLKMAGDFQKSTNVLVTAAGETQAGLTIVRNGIKGIAEDTGTSISNLTDGAYILEKAGYRGADAVTVLKAAAQGAVEEGANLGTVANAMTSVMASYNLKASDSVRVMNALKTGAGEAKTTMEQYAGSLSTVIPLASANKVSFAEVAGAMATMTQHGTSADEATQELSNTIRNLTKPNNVAVKEMANFGISAQDVQTHLGERGLTGTLDLLSQTVLQRMGPAGTALLNTFNTSKAAAADLTQMISAMPKQVADLAKQYQAGTITQGDYMKAAKELSGGQYAMATQFASTLKTSQGFNFALRNGVPGAETYSGAMAKMLGGVNGMNTALMLTGSNMPGFKDRVAAVGKSYNDNAKDVEGWKSTQKLFNVELAGMVETVKVAAINLGTKLIPVVQDTIKWMSSHKDIVLILAAAIGAVLTVTIIAWVGRLIWAAGESVVQFAKMIAAGVGWVIEQAASIGESIALWAMYAGEWIATQAAAIGESIALWAMYAAENIAEVASVVASNVAAAAGTAAAWIAANAAMLVAGGVILLALAALAFGAYELYQHWGQVWGAIKSVTMAAFNWLRNAFFTVIDFIKSHWQIFAMALATILLGPLGLIVAYVLTHLDQVKQIFSDGVDAVVSFFEGLPGRVINGLGNLGGLLLSKGREIVTGMLRGILDEQMSLANWFLGLGDWIVNEIGDLGQALWQKGSDLIQGLINGIMSAPDAIKNALESLIPGGGLIGKAASFIGLAEGGVVHQPTLALIGEGGETEYVVPQSKLAAFMAAQISSLSPGAPRNPLSTASRSPGLASLTAPSGGGFTGGDLPPVQVFLDGKQITDNVHARLLRDKRAGRKAGLS